MGMCLRIWALNLHKGTHPAALVLLTMQTYMDMLVYGHFNTMSLMCFSHLEGFQTEVSGYSGQMQIWSENITFTMLIVMWVWLCRMGVQDED